jgi:hypothetical protein
LRCRNIYYILVEILREFDHGKTRKIYPIAIVSPGDPHGYFCLKGGHTMFKFIKEMLATPTALDAFLASKSIKTHAELEYWEKYFQYRGM